MGAFVRHENEEHFIPEYRVTFGFAMLPTTTHIVRVTGNQKLHLEGTEAEQVLNAIHQAEIMLTLDENFAAGALNVGPKVLKVEREPGHLKPWEEVTNAFRLTKGMEIQVFNPEVLACAQPQMIQENEWVIFRRWEGCGDGTAILITSDHRRFGPYARQHVFVTR